MADSSTCVGYEPVHEVAHDGEYAAISDGAPPPLSPARMQREWKWARRDVKKDLFAMTIVAALLWVSVIPMRKSQERALRGLVCLSMVMFAALLIGWAVKRSAREMRGAHRPTDAQDPANQDEL